jgi:hypothetical protein
MRLIALVLSLMAGCMPANFAPDENKQISVAQIHKFYITVTETELSVVLHTITGQHAGPCEAALPDLSAQLDGVDVPVATYGGKVGEDPGDDVSDNECAAPRLAVGAPVLDHRSLLRMTDHGGTAACELPDLRTMRKATLVPAGPWELAAGEPVTVQWSPSSDLGHPIAINVQTGTAASGGTIIHGQVVQGDLVTFTLPALAPGPYTLGFAAAAGATCSPPVASADLHSSATFSFAQQIMVVR